MWQFLFLAAAFVWSAAGATGELVPPKVEPYHVGSPGEHELRVITPRVLELVWNASETNSPAPRAFELLNRSGNIRLPASNSVQVVAGTQTVAVARVGYSQRVSYAPLKKWDLRTARHLFLELADPVPLKAKITVRNPSGDLWPARATISFTCTNEPQRRSPVIHVSQAGYPATGPKNAYVGYYLGTLGELRLEQAILTNGFRILEATTGQSRFSGSLKPRSDRGFPDPAYQQVYELDFSGFTTPGSYVLEVTGLGISWPFLIHPGTSALLARTYALGLYHQRCGTDNALPFTRFTHGPCHTNPAVIPDDSSAFEAANYTLEQETENVRDNPKHTAPRLKSVSACLYPFTTNGAVAVQGGHHDAGDYSKYTINSASLVHQLVFAVDNFPGVAGLDNLGLPESGDGVSDVLQEAKWEADFLARMQDADGGFYFLVYPRGRRYEDNVAPDGGDPQVVFPKTTAATAAATAALAQCASSAAFKRAFSEAASGYLERARRGWAFLEKAIQKQGLQGAYQKITHYGDDFMHADELAWAACEIFLADRNTNAHRLLREWFDPASAENRKWGWWRLYDSWGCATRSYGFAVKSGRVKQSEADPLLVEKCQAELAAAGQDQLDRSEASAYGVSLPLETKRARSAGWFFPMDAAFDLAVASQLDFPERRDPRPRMLTAIWANIGYENGANPVNRCYLTGIGWQRQREIVHQHAQNDRRISPHTGIPLGAIQSGISWLNVYEDAPNRLSYPPDDKDYPFYDRWSDAFNLSQEFVVPNQARGLAVTAWLMAQSPAAREAWKPAPVSLEITAQAGNRIRIQVPKSQNRPFALTTWEIQGEEPILAEQVETTLPRLGRKWVEVESLQPDGRRIFAVTNLNSR